MASTLLRIAKTYPLRFGMAFSLFKTSGCDLLVQKIVEKREEIDWRRTVAFGSFGLFYLGGVQYFIYVPVFSRLFPGAAAFAAKPLSQKIAVRARNAAGNRAKNTWCHIPSLYSIPLASRTTQGLSIEHLQTEQHRSKRGQPHMFTTSCHVCSGVTPNRAALRKALKDLESELDVKIVFDVIDARLHRTVTG